MDKKKNIDEIIKEQLQEYQYEPTSSLWDRIETEFNKKSSAAESKPTYSPMRYAVAFFFIFCIGFAGSLLLHPFTNFSGSGKAITKNTFRLKNNFEVSRPLQYYKNTTSGSAVVAASSSTLTAQMDTKPEITGDKNTDLTAFEYIPEHIAIPRNNSTADPGKVAGIENINEAFPETEVKNTTAVPEENPDTNDEPSDIVLASLTPEDPAKNPPSLVRMTEKTSRYLTGNANTGSVKQSYYKEVADYSPSLHLRGMSFGVAASYNQTSLLENGNIFKGEKPIQSALKFGSSKGISIGYNFSNTFGMQVDYIYNAVEGQNYVMSEDEHIVQKTLSLYYNLIPVMVKLKVPRISDITQKPIVTNYIAGIQYGMLSEYRIPQEKRLGDPQDLFNNNDFSLLFGIDYDIYLSKQTYFSLGARTTISNDISSHQYPLDDFSKRNFVFGIRAGFNYTFRSF